MKAFDARVGKCSPATRDLLAFLRTVAAHAGTEVEPPIADKKGGGITYRRGRRRFCRFDPKHLADHVWASIPGAGRDNLKAAGTVSNREDGSWVTIENIRGAVRLVPEILRAYDLAGPKSK